MLAGALSIRGLTIEPGWLSWSESSPSELSDGMLLARCAIRSPDWASTMPLGMDWHGYREVSSGGGLVLPSLCLKSGEPQRNDGLGLFLDEPQAPTTRQDLDQAWFMQVSRHRTFAGHETRCVLRVGLILLPVAAQQVVSSSGS